MKVSGARISAGSWGEDAIPHRKTREYPAIAAILRARPSRAGRRIAMVAVITALATALPAGARATTYVWSGGAYMPGTTSPDPLLSPDILSIETATDKTFASNFTNQSGQVDWLGGFILISGATVTNNSLWRALSTSATMSGGMFINDGIFRQEGPGETRIRGGFINNGTIDAETGTINFKANPIFNDGTIFTGAGIVEILSQASFNGAISSTNLLLNGGTFTGTAVALSGIVNLAEGTFAGDWTNNAGSTLNITGTGGKSITGTLTNNGIVTWDGGDIHLVNGGVLANKGTMEISGDVDLIRDSGAGYFVNWGVVSKTGGGGTTFATPMINLGTIDVEAGSITLPNNFTNLGTFAGTGTFALSGMLTNDGTIAPGTLGTGVGALTLQGDYRQAGFLNIQFGAGGSSDMFLVTGAASLDGSLGLFCAGCSLSVGDLFTILDSGGALTGMFATTTATGFNPGFAYTLLYDTADGLVKVRIDNIGTPPSDGGVPEPASWAMLVLGFGFVGGSLRTAPALAKKRTLKPSV